VDDSEGIDVGEIALQHQYFWSHWTVHHARKDKAAWWRNPCQTTIP